MKRTFKWIAHRLAASPVAVALLTWWIRTLYACTKPVVFCPPDAKNAIRANQSFLLVTWHKRVAYAPWIWPEKDRTNSDHKQSGRERVFTFASTHRDGQFITAIYQRLGFSSILTDKSAPTQAFRQAVDILTSPGKIVAIAADGPKGPPEIAKIGAIKLARQAQVPIFPVAVSANRSFHLRSWDHTSFPWPFARVHILWGKPILPPDLKATKSDLEDYRQNLQDQLLRLEQAASSHNQAQ